MSEAVNFYINMLQGNMGGLSAVGALKSLDDNAAKAQAGIKALEGDLASAKTKLDKLGSTENIDALTSRLTTAKQQLAGMTTGKVAFNPAEYRRASDEVGKLGSQLEAAKAKHSAALEAQAGKVDKLSGKLGAAKDAEASGAALLAAKRAATVKGLDDQVASLSSVGEAAKSAGGPIGSLVSGIEKFAKGGPVAIAAAVAVAILAMGVAIGVAVVALTRYAFAAADAARSSALFSEAATGSAAGGKELETVVDQMSNLAPGLAAKMKDVGRSLADVGIRGRDAQRTLEAFGIVATARGEQAAGAIKSIAESSRTANRLMLGPFNRITGQFDSLKGTGIKSADVFSSLAKVMGTSAEAARKAATTGLVPYRKGLEAIELAAKASLGGVVAKQMMSLSAALDKLKENVAKMFSGANIEKFLEGLKTVTDLFDTNTVTGYVLREVFTSVFTSISEIAAKVFPYVRVLIMGMAMGVMIVATAAKQLYRAFQDTFGGALKNMDGLRLAFIIGGGLIGGLVGGIVGLGVAFLALGAIIVIATAPLWAPFALLALAIYAIDIALTAVVDAAKGLGKEIEDIDLGKAAENIMNSLIDGIKAKIADVSAAIKSVGAAITGGFDSEMEIKSPSKVMTRRANWVVDPLVSVPAKRAGEVQAAMGGLGDLDDPRAQVGPSGNKSGSDGPPIIFNSCTFGGGDEDSVRRIIREERRMFFLGEARGYA
jgi:hypothetical protein